MKTLRSKFSATFSFLGRHPIASTIVAAALMIGFVGCSAEQVEKGAQDLAYVTGESTTKPTSQPASLSTGLDIARTGAAVASATVPGASGLFKLIGSVAMVVVGVAGHFTGKSVAQKKNNSVITEIMSDVAAFKDKSMPWTEKTARLLNYLGVDHDGNP